jgi:hypothetical protein
VTCYAGARWVREEVLEATPGSPLRVLVVWSPNLPGDFRRSVDRRLLADRRVTNFWDEDATVDEWFAARAGADTITWDAFYLYGPEASWSSLPSRPVALGSPVFDRKDELRAALRRLGS